MAELTTDPRQMGWRLCIATPAQRARHAARPEDFLWRYRVLMWRRLLGEGLEDLLVRRWDLP